MKLYKYQGAGNDFLIADNRNGEIVLTEQKIRTLCHRRYGIGADGVMLLEKAFGFDFKMVYYNSDGSGGMMCGNGGRCIVAFAAKCGITKFDFIAADGPHTAEILEQEGKTSTVKLKMKDVTDIKEYDIQGRKCWFLDTGTRHLVCPVDSVDDVNVESEGRELRYLDTFAPQGVNVNFVNPQGAKLRVRTYEKGVEDETYACGTGITASAIAFWHSAYPAGEEMPQRVYVPVQALRDQLAVEFTPTKKGAEDVYLIGPATEVAEILID